MEYDSDFVLEEIGIPVALARCSSVGLTKDTIKAQKLEPGQSEAKKSTSKDHN